MDLFIFSERTQATVHRHGITDPVRAFYLDLSHWAVEDPARWGSWVAPCPVGSEEVSRRKDMRRRKFRMDARTRERLPVLPVLAATVAERRRRPRPAALQQRERHVLKLAASIAAGTPVSLSDALTGIDRRNASLVVEAVAHASALSS